jgi:hypothetical protein
LVPSPTTGASSVPPALRIVLEALHVDGERSLWSAS